MRTSVLLFRGIAGIMKFPAPKARHTGIVEQAAVDIESPDAYADLLYDSAKSDSSSMESSWNSKKFPKSSILWPSPELEKSRAEAFGPRLSELWSLSGSHGISWDELDDAFLEFHREYVASEAEWVSNYDMLWNKEYAESERVLRKLIPGSDSEKTLILSRRRGKIRRMTYTRISRIRFDRILKPFHMRQFLDRMRNVVTAKMLQREESEKLLV